MAHLSLREIIKCKAVSTSDCIGCLYDIRRNSILNQVDVHIEVQNERATDRSVTCLIVKCHEEDNINFLKMIGVEDHLRFKLYLETDAKKYLGVSAVIHHRDAFHRHTRFFYYCWLQKQQSITDKIIKTTRIDTLKSTTSQATHLITSIGYGIDLLIVLQLPDDDQIVSSIDQQLKTIKNSLINGDDASAIVNQEVLHKITHTTVYSNVITLSAMKSLLDVLRAIAEIHNQPSVIYPVYYLLHPLQLFLSPSVGKAINYQSLPLKICEQIERYILRIRSFLKRLQLCRRVGIQYAINIQFFHGNFTIKQELLEAEKEYIEHIQELSRNVTQYENVQIDVNSMLGVMKTDQDLERWAITCARLSQNAYELETKSHFIHNLIKQHFEYHHLENIDITIDDDEITIQRKLTQGSTDFYILCSNDELNRKDPIKFKELQCSLMSICRGKPHLRLIYADFSYCNYPLRQMMILPKDTNVGYSKTSSSKMEVDKNLINVLLVGQSGVGKSTFINALINYLTFESLGKAQQSKPVVLIPISFVITTGVDFEEQLLTFGDQESVPNENFNDQGQSVTQQCRSYTFRIPSNERQQIRIIDTPGFGDTRGIEQDKVNIQHILDYVKNISYLNAICFLLKPNESKMNIFFRTCCHQLFSLLDNNAHRNLMFCFTSARSTFYAPGNTAILLHKMLSTFDQKHEIKLEKTNTFCFDNEAFRYLVAKSNNIEFTEEEQNEYERSWRISVKESHRLLEQIQSLRPTRRDSTIPLSS